MSDMTKAELVRKVALLQAENQRLRYELKRRSFWGMLVETMRRAQ